MDDKIIFKTATVGGFEKKAVTDYIFQMNEDNDYAQQQLKNKVSELEELVIELENEKAESKQRIEFLQEELSNSAQRVSSKDQKQEKLSSLSDELTNKIDLLEHKLKEKEREGVAQTTRNKELEERYSDLEAQREEIARTTAQLGRVMLDARTDSDFLVETANTQADQITSKAKQEADALLKGAEDESNELKNKLKAQSDNIIKDAQQEASEILEDARDFSEATLFAAEEQSKSIIESTQSRVATMVSIGKNTTDATNDHLTSLRKQASAIQETITEAFRQILEQSTVLEDTISHAESSIGDLESLSKTADLFEVPDLSKDDIRGIKERMKEHSKSFKMSMESGSHETEKEGAPNDQELPTVEPSDDEIAPVSPCETDGCAVPSASFVEEDFFPIHDFSLEAESSFEVNETVTLPALSDMSSVQLELDSNEDSFFLGKNVQQ